MRQDGDLLNLPLYLVDKLQMLVKKRISSMPCGLSFR